MQREQIQLQKVPLEYSSQPSAIDAKANDQLDGLQPEFVQEHGLPEKSGHQEAKKRRTAMERKQSGGGRPSKGQQYLTLDNQEGDWQSSSLLGSQ